MFDPLKNFAKNVLTDDKLKKLLTESDYEIFKKINCETQPDINFLDSPDETSIYNMSSYGEIETLISKIPNVKKIRSLNVSYSKDGVLIEKFSNMTGELEPTFSEEYQIMLNNLKNGSAYYTIKHQIKSII